MFKILDWFTFISILLIPILIGLYHSGILKHLIRRTQRVQLKLKNSKSINAKKTSPVISEEIIDIEMIEKSIGADKVANYVIANSSMSSLPIACSMLASFFSTTTLLGIPAEVYQYGVQYYICAFSMTLSPLFGAYVTGPFFARHKIISIYEYLQMRYDSLFVRMVGTTLFVIKAIISTAIFIYGPATSLSVFSVFDDKYSIAIIGLIATFYTAIGINIFLFVFFCTKLSFKFIFLKVEFEL
jgi:hypothetical protein